MGKHFVGKVCLAVALSSALAGAGVTVTTTTQASASVAKNPPKKHKKHKKHKKKSTVVSASDRLKALASGVAAEKGATFEVVYTTTSSGHTESVTFAQSPPKYLVKVGTSGSLIYTGSETLYCATATECISTGETTNPLASIEDLFSPTTARDFLEEAEVEVASKAAGYSVSFSSGTFGGLSSECVSVTGHGQKSKYCVADNGLLTYAGSSTGSITLTSYKSSVPSTAFTPPSGATIVTEPS